MDGKVLQDAVIAPNDNWSAVFTPQTRAVWVNDMKTANQIIE